MSAASKTTGKVHVVDHSVGCVVSEATGEVVEVSMTTQATLSFINQADLLVI